MSEVQGTSQSQQAHPQQDIDEELEEMHVFQLPYAAVDASVGEYLFTLGADIDWEIHRHQLTSGSVLYRLTKDSETSTKKYELATVTIRMINVQLTYLKVDNGGAIQQALQNADPQERTDTIQKFAAGLLSSIVEWIDSDQSTMTSIGNIMRTRGRPLSPQDINPWDALTALLAQDKMPTRRGRPPATENEWVRQEIQRGRSRKDVFAEYLQRQKVDPNNEDQVRLAKDRFRKALQRKKGT